jgi:hypothetical protein
MSNIAMSIRSQRRDHPLTSPDDSLGESLGGVAPSTVAERIPGSSSPNVNNKSHIITAVVDQPRDGVLLEAAGIVAGYALLVQDGKADLWIQLVRTGALSRDERGGASCGQELPANERADIELLSELPKRYGVSLTAAILRWLEYTETRAIMIVSNERFAFWSR